MYSERFGKEIIVTNHARLRMSQREVHEQLLLEVLETGEVEELSHGHLFVHKLIAGRRDNLVCIAAVEEARLVVKTVMVNWTRRVPL